ncbi:dihydrodipicolinate synthase family protein [Ktedonospora formicarum]|uniref:Dihydrodipicolinate synthase family protein n=1 Tax=Ktedonospora formicarum TaxID=2778364 RepID=A0A8J3HXW6_9CHLR|nr:dihydrodipicolinate synthase family protein [Ktedonospora formicarum]GHO42652.1 dihydrodipicolinate synthase family protein [Ktedonospora formicarum]
MTHHLTRFIGVVPPLCTPMTTDFEVDIPSLERLIAFQLENGVHGLFVLGSSGEAAFLTDKQRATVIEVTVRNVAGQVPVLAGVIDMTTAQVLEHARLAKQAGVDALVVTAPFYTRISQAEIIEHFRILHHAVNIPLFAYDIPAAVHTKITRETMRTLADEHLICGIKDSSGDEANFRSLAMDMGPRNDIQVFTGSELLVDAALLMGANGCVPGLGNVDPAGYVRLYEAARSGDWQRARQEQERLYRLFEIVSVGTHRMGIGSSAMGAFKAALYLRGIIQTYITGRPSILLNKDEITRIRHIMQAAELLGA